MVSKGEIVCPFSLKWLIDSIHFQRFTSIEDAKKMCPHLRIQHVATYRNGESEAGYWDDVDPRTHKVSLDVYRRESLKILAIFKEKIPRGEIGKLVEANRRIGLTIVAEKASIDEAFLDLTPMVIERLLAAHPYLSKVPEDAPNGLDSPLPPPPQSIGATLALFFPSTGKRMDPERTIKKIKRKTREVKMVMNSMVGLLGAIEIPGRIGRCVWVGSLCLMYAKRYT